MGTVGRKSLRGDGEEAATGDIEDSGGKGRLRRGGDDDDDKDEPRLRGATAELRPLLEGLPAFSEHINKRAFLMRTTNVRVRNKYSNISSASTPIKPQSSLSQVHRE